jgi:hypothetical protein
MMVFKKSIPRRKVLKGIGATLALPLLDGMIPAFAGPADTAAKPVRRMGFVYVPNGIIPASWRPTIEGLGFEITPIMEALTPFREHLLVLSGLDQKHADPGPFGEGGGAPHSLTGGAYLTGVFPKQSEGVNIRAGVSVDQIAAKELGKQTHLASLELGLDPVEASGYCEGGYSCAYLNTISWRTPTTPMPMEDRPRAVFERLFGDSETTNSAERLARAEENRSLLDFVTEDTASLSKGLTPADRNKLNEYLDAVRDVERRIQLAEQQASREIPTLERPAAGFPASFEDYAKLMFDLQVLAYQTDLTRIITFMMAHERSGRSYREVGVPDSHHGVSHHRNDPVNIEKLVRINTYHVKLFSYYVEKLRATRDGDGSLLDHTMIVYGSGINNSNEHTHDNLPTLVVGGAGGKVKGGRHLRSPLGTPMTNLYVSMLNIMGIPVEKFGDCNGKLDLLSVG